MVRIKLRKISWYDIIGVTILSLCTTAMTRSQFNGVWGTVIVPILLARDTVTEN